MSRDGSIKESILSIYLKENTKLLSNTLGFNVENLTLEQRHANRNIDIRGIDSKRRIPVNIEVQLKKANKVYLKRMKKMVETYNESVVIWIASSFDGAILSEIKEWLYINQKNFVDFYALSLHDEALTVLEKLNEMYHLDIYHHLQILNELKPLLKTELEIKQIHPTHCGQLNPTTSYFDLNRTEDVKRALLQVLRTRIPNFINFHYDKKTNQQDHILTVGAGRDGLVYRCSAKSAKSLAFVELYFDSFREKEYDEFKKMKQLIRLKVHSQIRFENRRIGVYFPPLSTYEETFEQIAEIFERFIHFYSLYFYGEKDIKVREEREDKTTEGIQSVIITRLDYLPDSSINCFLDEEPWETEDSYRIRQEGITDFYLHNG